MLKRFSIYDLVVIALLAATGVAIKPVVATIAHALTASLVPGGSLVGGLYMLWIVLAYALTGKIGAATLAGLVQALMVMLTGVPGSHGVMSLLTYTGPGIAVDVLMLLMVTVAHCKLDFLNLFLAGLIANVTGTFLVNLLLLRNPSVFLVLILAAAALSGGIGGIIAWWLYKAVDRAGLARRGLKKEET